MRKICMVLLLALVLTGCKTTQELKPDTIVDIPLRPTDGVTQPVTESPQTEPVTRPPAPEVPTNGWVPVETTPSQPQSYDPGGYTPGSLDRAVADAINARRQDAGLTLLTLDPRLCAIASVRAWENTVLLGAYRPDGSAGIMVLHEYGYPYTAAAESVCLGANSAEQIVDMWMAAENYRGKLLMDASVIGVGTYVSPDGVTYVAALYVK